jgi:hypothetical protein
MKRLTMLFVAVLAATTFAQGRDFGGTWVLDAEKSSTKQGPGTMTIVLGANEFKVTMGLEMIVASSLSPFHSALPLLPCSSSVSVPSSLNASVAALVPSRADSRGRARADPVHRRARHPVDRSAGLLCADLSGGRAHPPARDLKQFLRTLDPAHFVRVHRSAAVNIRHVRELTITVSGGLTAKLASGAEVAVARPFRTELEERLRALP